MRPPGCTVAAVTVVLGLLAALAYGLSDFAGGVASRYRGATTVLLHAYPVGALLALVALPLLPGPLSWATFLWGVAGGVAGLAGVLCLYSALTAGPMSILSPVSAVLAAVVPIVVGLAIGERPAVLAWAGVAVGLVAVALVGGGGGAGSIPVRALGLAVAAGLGFGVYFVCLARADPQSGVWPLLVSRLTSAVLIVPFARRTGALHAMTGRALGLALVAGTFDASANLAFLLASREGLLSLASVLTSLYPAVTVVLAAVVLKERPTVVQRLGLAAAAASIVLITV